ncbi:MULTISPECIES: protein MgtR [Pantoea]|nr:protein MgtR [Pantoea stewartii subsp. stewartii]MBC0855601.1 protein MgtR [Pantoea stewartii]PXV74037.1 hypothetical protein C7433_105109 [Pantoea sp. PNA 03-3]TDS67955.1 hypothetical protein C7434_3700 [Pantoea sp. PNA 14-12]WRH15467.1 protein MgtR [Pantoea sp. JZ2]WRH23263.1 protein MgtR [Pantoea sp. JZ29]
MNRSSETAITLIFLFVGFIVMSAGIWQILTQ